MLAIRHFLLLSTVFLSACTFQTRKPETAQSAPVTPNTPPATLQNPAPNPDPLASLDGPGAENLNEAADVWGRMRKGFSLAQVPESKFQSELKFYGRYPSFMQGVSQRGSRFLYYVVDEIEKRKMPMEVALIPVIESAYDPKARSPGGAAGLWQMMAGTGKILGLKRTASYDGRHDVVASTDAALNYLQRLAGKFGGDWHLALAAYNCGEMNVIKAMNSNRAKGLPTDYWSLNLPYHTEVYLPKILAIRAIVMNPSKYKVDLHPIPNKPYFAKVNIHSQINLTAAAQTSGVDYKVLRELNPAIQQTNTDPAASNVLVPFHAADRFAAAMNNPANKSALLAQPAAMVSLPANPGNKTQVADAKGNKITHKVQKGDSLWTLSKRYKVSIQQISQWNNLPTKASMKPGKQLVIWQQ
jgi:membrane-bound lytic murein transglycosylase D